MKLPSRPGSNPPQEGNRFGRYPKQADPFYSTKEWRVLRAQVIREEPICRDCGVEMSEHAAHIIAKSIRPDLALVRSNIRGACKACHGKETLKDTRRNRQ